MLDRHRAEKLARWVNEHDDGTPMPRAIVAEINGRFVVKIRSTEVHLATRVSNVVTETARNSGEARAILGY